jgi:hypothetical protein
MGEMRNAYIFVTKHDSKKPLGRPKCIWEDNTGMDLRETECQECALDASGSGQETVVGGLVNTVMNLRVL